MLDINTPEHTTFNRQNEIPVQDTLDTNPVYGKL